MLSIIKQAVLDLMDNQFTDDPKAIVIGNIILAMAIGLNILFTIRHSKKLKPDPWKMFCKKHEVID